MHAILHLAPLALVLPVQRKALRLLSISVIAQAERQQVIEICTGMADNVVCRLRERRAPHGVQHTSLPGRDPRGHLVHEALLVRSPQPRQVHGNCWTRQGKTCWTAATSSSEQRIEVTWHLSRGPRRSRRAVRFRGYSGSPRSLA